MTKISQPYVFRYTGPDWGISGFVVIAESHISVHTFVERDYVNIDIFSCRDFDSEKAVGDLKDKFKLIKFRTYLLDREWLTPQLACYSQVVELQANEK